MDRRLADWLLSDMKAVLSGWVAQHRVSRADVQDLLIYLAIELDEWVKLRQEKRMTREVVNHEQNHSPNGGAAG